ncbi:MAG: thiolase family protein [Desulfobacterales bacterium]|nr:thiolase family protein [Desulfobacterales bacterium]
MKGLLSYEDVVVTDAVRIPIGKFGGTLKDFDVVQLGAMAIKALLERSKIDPALIEEVVMSHTRQDGTGTNPARNMALFGGVPIHVPAQTVNMVCPAGLKAQHIGAMGIRTGERELSLVGGGESMSNIPHLLRGARWQGYRLTNITIDDGFLYLTDKWSNLGPGNTAEYTNEKFGFTREEQEQIGVESHQKAAKGWADGIFDAEVVPVKIPGKKGQEEITFAKDECYREDASLEKMMKLPTPFKKDGTVTAGSSSGITDGSGAMLMMSRKKAEELGRKPLFHFVDFMFLGVEPKDFLEGPGVVMPKILEKNKLTIDDMKYVEINEAFATCLLTAERMMKWKDRGKLNPHGGCIALGHPTGYSGIRLNVHLAHTLKKGEYGLACLCGGGGMAGAAIIQSEREA